MMKINIDGVGSKKSDILERAAIFFANQLLHKRTIKNIVLDIEVFKNLSVQGQCLDDEGVRNPRWFTIVLDNCKIEDMVQTLAHEMVHLKQFAKNELKMGQPVASRGGMSSVTLWNGKPWVAKKNEDVYYDSPWEIAAYGMEVGLYHKWKKYSQSC